MRPWASFKDTKNHKVDHLQFSGTKHCVISSTETFLGHLEEGVDVGQLLIYVSPVRSVEKTRVSLKRQTWGKTVLG